jgi:hypothetical protein
MWGKFQNNFHERGFCMNQSQRALQNLATGTHSAFGEKIHWSYYDRLILAAAGTVFPFFQLPIGPGRTLADTNMTTAGVIPVNQNFKIRALTVNYAQHADIATATIALIYAFIRDVTISMSINGKAPTFQFPLTSLMGIPLLAHTTPAATITDILQSSGKFSGVFPLNVPITLAAQTNFVVNLEYPAALGAIAIVGDFLKISLDGILERAS